MDELVHVEKKFLGQNFLINEEVVQKIISFFDEKDTVLEIGPGYGNITKHLLTIVKFLVVIEKDKQIIKELEKTVEKLILPVKKLLIVSGDYLEKSFEVKNNIDKPYKVFGNIPYYITKKIITDILTSNYQKNLCPESALLMLQKEVAERVVGKNKDRSFLTILSHFYSRPELVEWVSRSSFSPQPKVDSALVFFALLKPNRHILDLRQEDIGEREFLKFVHIGFSSPRKKLKNNLASAPDFRNINIDNLFERAGISPNVRAEELSVDEWVQLVVQMKK